MNQKQLVEIEKAFSAIGETLVEKMERLLPTAQRFYDAVYAQYLEEGAIYGESHEGVMRWIEDLAEIDRHRQAIEEIKMRHWIIADTKRMIKKRNLTTPEESL